MYRTAVAAIDLSPSQDAMLGPLLLQGIEPVARGRGAGAKVVCVETLRHVLLATDLSKHAGAAERAAVVLAGRADRVDCLSVLTPDGIDATPALPLMARAALDALQVRMAAIQPDTSAQGRYPSVAANWS